MRLIARVFCVAAELVSPYLLLISAIGVWLAFGQRLSAVKIDGSLVVLVALGAVVLDVRSSAVPADIPLSVSAGD